jgi:vanillate O-demethylase monooxygenase subunit
MHQMDSAEWAGDGRTIYAECNYQLVLDNLMDLTHEEFVHSSSIGQEALSESEFEVTHDDRRVTVSRWMRDIDPPPFWRKNMRDKFPDFEGRVDRWQIIHYYAPSTICIDVGVARAGTGAPEGDRSQGVNGYVMNTITPETDRTCHYFWAFCRNYNLGEQRITHIIREGVTGVFGEDEVIFAAQQKAIEAHPDKQFYNLNIDSGAMWARRLIDTMIAEESDDRRYRESAEAAAVEISDGPTTRSVEATEADAARLGV